MLANALEHLERAQLQAVQRAKETGGNGKAAAESPGIGKPAGELFDEPFTQEDVG